MAQVTITHDPGVTVEVIAGDPPVDQSAEVAALTAQVAALTAERDGLAAKLQKLNDDIDAAQGQ